MNVSTESFAKLSQTTNRERSQVAEHGREGRDVSKYLQRPRVSGRVMAGLLLLVTLPVIAVLAILIRLTSAGPAFFSQQRVGLAGRKFSLFKLRTMRVDAEAKTGPVWAAQRDSRVTLLGKILRKTHLDELPQLWNVVRGDMALIGPRPERPEFVRHLAVQIPSYLERLQILPGITGLAQIRLPPDTSLESVRRKTGQDLHYLEHATLWLDLRIAACTMLRLIGVPGVRCAKLVRLHDDSLYQENGPRSQTTGTTLSSLVESDHTPPRKPR